jgi:Sap, sulfolipid-1-addressing protein
VIFELIVLALATAVRPTSLAAVCALLASTAPRRVMTAYIAAGAAFTVGFGLLVILVFHGVGGHPSDSQGFGVAEIVGGAVAIVLGLLLLTGRIGEERADEAPPTPKGWLALLNKRVTTRTAALAGPVTHLPGFFYLLALNLIISHQVWPHTGLVSLLVYNAVWFCLPIAALAICIVNPGVASDAVGALEQWARRHSRVILLTASFGVGTALIIDGLQRT